METKRIILATAVSMAILFGWHLLFPPPPPTPRSTVEAAPQAVAPEMPPPASPAGDPVLAEAMGERLAGETVETVDVETQLFQVRLTNRGAAVESWKLREYTQADGQPVEFFRNPPGKEQRLLTLDLGDPELDRRVNGAVFAVERERLGRDQATGGERIIFRWADGAGLEVRKTLVFREDSYLVDLEVDVTDRGRQLPVRVALGPGFAAQDPALKHSSYYYDGQAVLHRDGIVTRVRKATLVKSAGSASGDVRWAGLEDQYFAALVIPGQTPATVSWRADNLSTPPGETTARDKEPPGESLVQVSVAPEGGRLFVGPKKYTLLAEYGNDLERVIWFSSYSLLAPVSKGIFLGLLWIHDHTVPNWGLAIIVATFALRLLLFPVNQFAMVSMKKAQLQMQRIQPKVNAIRAKYKKVKDADSRAKMNQEMMDLYKREGVNPMGGLSGCLPLLAQFPILIGFFNMLTVAVELRGAPFFGWIQDLSREDPFWITPLLMGVTMFIQQWMAMSRVKDPQQLQQQRMMLFMPIVFTWVCLSMPSGLVLYWFVNNLLGIGQQWLVNRHTERLETAAQKA